MYSYLFSLITAGLITAFAIPSIIRIAEIKHLFDVPDERKHHKTSVPTLGGMAIFAGLIFAVTFWTDQIQIVELQYIITSLLILFFIGIKDDLVNLRASKKLLGQILAALILVHMANVKLTTFYGMFGVRDLPIWFSYLFSVFTCVVITNAFNLIDGIDGLAGSLGIVGAFTFGLWFHFLGMSQYTILCSALIGSLLAFLWFNKTPAKIFMGDTGSMIVGFVMALLAMKFIESVRVLPREHDYKILSVPVFTCTILIIPLFDTLRVFIIRLGQGKSPFNPDRNHIHHILIDLGLSHLQATLSLVLFTVLMILLVFFLQGLKGEILLALILVIPTMITHVLTKMRFRGFRKTFPWYMKLGVKLIRGILPINYKIFAKLGFFRHGKMDSTSYALNVFKKHFPDAQFIPKDPFVFLEIGPGDSLFSGIIASSKGAKKSYLIDNGDYATKDISNYLTLIEELYGSDYLKNLNINTLDDIKKHFNIEYMTHGLESLKLIPDNTIDFSFSNACFEHINGNQVQQYFIELHRVSKINSYSSHCIDFKDHLSYSLNNLRFSKFFWESGIVKKSGIYTNRLRFSDMKKAIEQAGFKCQVSHVEKWDLLPINISKLHADFKNYQIDDDLLVKEAWYRLT